MYERAQISLGRAQGLSLGARVLLQQVDRGVVMGATNCGGRPLSSYFVLFSCEVRCSRHFCVTKIALHLVLVVETKPFVLKNCVATFLRFDP